MNKQIQKLLSIVLVLTFLVVVITGCSKPKEVSNGKDKGNNDKDSSVDNTVDPEEKITLTFWHTYGDGEEAQLKNVVIPMWQEMYQNITI